MVCKKQDGLEAELPIAEVEEVLKTWAKEIHDHRIVIAFRSKPSYKRNTDTTSKCLINLRLVLELRVLRLHRLQLDSHLFPGNDINSEVDITWEKER